MPLAKLAARDHRLAAQLATVLGSRRKHFAELLVDPCDDARHLRDHLVLGRFGLVFGEEPVLAHLLLGRPELVARLG